MAVTAGSIFGEIIYALRNKAGLTQEKLAEFSYYSRDYIYRLEKGERGPGVKTFSRLGPPLKIHAVDLHNMFLNRLKDEGILEKWIKED